MPPAVGMFLLDLNGNLAELGRAMVQQGTALLSLHEQVADEDEPSPEMVAAVRSWLRTKFGDQLLPAAERIRAHFVDLAFDPPPEGEVISYRETRKQLGLGGDDPFVPAAWSTVLRRFTQATHGHKLLVQVGKPMREGRQDQTYRLNPQAAAAVRAAAGPRS